MSLRGSRARPRFLGVDIAANEATRDEAPELAWLEIDKVVVKGKTLPITAYALVGDEGVAREPSASRRSPSVHEAMLDAFRCRAFDKALELAEEAVYPCARPKSPGFTPSTALASCDVLEALPGEDWSPVLTLEEK